MKKLDLFPDTHIIGVFRSFREGGLEFHADLVLPYRTEFQSIPMHGQFLLVQLETPEEAVLGRISSFSSEGKLSGGTGEEFTIRAMRESRVVPEDLREQYLKYRVNIRVLGVVRNTQPGTLTFVASHRRLPHVGSAVAFASAAVLQEIAGHTSAGAAIGHLALGEYIYAEGSPDIELSDWMQIKSPEVLIKFPVESLVSRRSFIFARAGFGKSNLNKLLFSKLYEHTPTVTKRGGRQVPVGTIIFDPDGEYFWPDDKGRPGLCDVPTLQDKLVVFTPRKGPSPFYHSFVAGGIRLDIRRFSASDIISIALPPERQEQQNVRKLVGLDAARWEKLVNLIAQNYNQAPLEEIAKILDLLETQETEILAARGTMSSIVRMLHDPGSQLMDMLLKALAAGKLCIVDLSQMRGAQALVLSGLILRRIFDWNQEQFTAADSRTIPTIAVVEEAQSVLNEKAAAAAPYIAWVKEGRKYDLGALLITQQPGSIPTEILSQGDNWFIFHLLSGADLWNVQRANAHFSEDLLSALLNEPIPGQGIFWSSVGGKPYPVPLRALSFERLYPMLDPQYDRATVPTYATHLRAEYQHMKQEVLQYAQQEQREVLTAQVPLDLEGGPAPGNGMADGPDILHMCREKAIAALRANTALLSKIKGEGVAYGTIKAFLKGYFPENFQDRDELAYQLVSPALDTILGTKSEGGWHSFRYPGRNTTYVHAGAQR